MSCVCCIFFFKQKTAYEMRISDWSSDVCSSDLKIGTNAGIDSRVARALGAEPVPLNSVDLLPAFLCGRVDAVSLADGSAHVFGIGQNACVRLEKIGRAACRERACQYV